MGSQATLVVVHQVAVLGCRSSVHFPDLLAQIAGVVRPLVEDSEISHVSLLLLLLLPMYVLCCSHVLASLRADLSNARFPLLLVVLPCCSPVAVFLTPRYVEV